MSVTYSGELPGSFNYQDGSGYIYTRKFLYLLTPGSFPDDISTDSNLPKPNDAHPRHVDYTVKTISEPTFQEGKEPAADGSYVVTVSYKRESDTADPIGAILPWNLDPYNISYDTKIIVVPQEKAYQSGDDQFVPSLPVAHPVTKEPILIETDNSIGIIRFSYNLRNFNYEWKREFEGTINSSGQYLLGDKFQAKNLILKSLSATYRNTEMNNGDTVYYYEIAVEFEDLGKEYDQLVALRGFMMRDSGEVANIQLQEGVYGSFDQTDRSLDIQSMVYVDGSTGSPAQLGSTISDSYYYSFPARFGKNWGALSLPKSK
jgi:hypothetical protein